MEWFLPASWSQLLYFIIEYCSILQQKKKKEESKKYSCETLWWDDEEIQVIPVCPHKLFATFQVKLPFDVKELYQLTKIACSSGFKIPIQEIKRKHSEDKQ